MLIVCNAVFHVDLVDLLDQVLIGEANVFSEKLPNGVDHKQESVKSIFNLFKMKIVLCRGHVVTSARTIEACSGVCLETTPLDAQSTYAMGHATQPTAWDYSHGMDWQREADELHVFFENYFLGTEDSLDRAIQAFAPDFTHVGPTGIEQNRAEVIKSLADGHAHTESLKIYLTNHRLLAEDGDLIVATYDEHHELSEQRNARRHTVVFRRNASAPHGVHWLRVQETWLDRP